MERQLDRIEKMTGANEKREARDSLVKIATSAHKSQMEFIETQRAKKADLEKERAAAKDWAEEQPIAMKIWALDDVLDEAHRVRMRLGSLTIGKKLKAEQLR